MTTISSSTILNGRPGKRGDLSNISGKLQKSVENITNSDKYNSRADLVASGLAGIHDTTQRSILTANGNKITTQVTSIKLNNEHAALESFNDIMVDFEQKRSNSASFLENNKKNADDALKALNVLLRRQNGAGRYVFGGNEPYIDPLSKIDANGQRVQLDLTIDNNVVKGIAINNYSPNTSSNKTITTISEIHEVKESFIHAGMQGITDAIGYLNKVKQKVDNPPPSPDAISDEDLEVAKQTQKKGRDDVTNLINLELKKVSDATDVNKATIKRAEESISALFKRDIVEATGEAKDLLNALFASISTKQIGDKAFDHLLNNTRV